MLHPDAEISISEIARRAGVLQPVAQREVTRLLEGGVLLDRREGRSRLVRPNTSHPLWSLMSQLVMETYGPVPVLRALVADREDISEAYIYGSWAARRSGDLGPPPRDLDVLVVGTPPRVELLDIAEDAAARLRIEVNVHTTTPEAWAAKADPFLQTVASRPLVPLMAPRHQSVDEESDG